VQDFTVAGVPAHCPAGHSRSRPCAAIRVRAGLSGRIPSKWPTPGRYVNRVFSDGPFRRRAPSSALALSSGVQAPRAIDEPIVRGQCDHHAICECHLYRHNWACAALSRAARASRFLALSSSWPRRGVSRITEPYCFLHLGVDLRRAREIGCSFGRQISRTQSSIWRRLQGRQISCTQLR
jgi:hypothetical protein